MSDRFNLRWERLVASARRAPEPDRQARRPGFVEQVARRALLARTTGRPRLAEPLAWTGLAGLAAAAAALVLLWPGPVVSTAEALGSAATALPRTVPHAPALPRAPAAPRPRLPSREDALAAVARLPGLALPFPTRRTETP